MITYSSSLELDYIGGFFQKQSINEIILGIGLFSSVARILNIDYELSIDYISSISLKVVIFWGELNLGL